jgi:hypothetical protein
MHNIVSTRSSTVQFVPAALEGSDVDQERVTDRKGPSRVAVDAAGAG